MSGGREAPRPPKEPLGAPAFLRYYAAVAALATLRSRKRVGVAKARFPAAGHMAAKQHKYDDG